MTKLERLRASMRAQVLELVDNLHPQPGEVINIAKIVKTPGYDFRFYPEGCEPWVYFYDSELLPIDPPTDEWEGELELL